VVPVETAGVGPTLSESVSNRARMLAAIGTPRALALADHYDQLADNQDNIVSLQTNIQRRPGRRHVIVLIQTIAVFGLVLSAVYFAPEIKTWLGFEWPIGCRFWNWPIFLQADSMPKPLSKWRVLLVGDKRATPLGIVEAPDEKTALEIAFDEFEVTNPETQKRLVAQKLGWIILSPLGARRPGNKSAFPGQTRASHWHLLDRTQAHGVRPDISRIPSRKLRTVEVQDEQAQARWQIALSAFHIDGRNEFW
jgi:hypothetical protein